MKSYFDATRKRISRRACLTFLPAAGLAGSAAATNAAASRTGNVRTVDDLDTPSMVIDMDVLEKNIREMQEVCNKEDIALQVHSKTHKIPEIALMQMRAGAVGICCQKLGEAEAMVEGGVRENILIPYNIVSEPKLIRLARVCKRARMTVGPLHGRSKP